MIFEFDPMYFVLEDISTEPMYRTTFEILRNILIRAFFLLGGFEAGRIVGFVILAGLFMIEAIQRSLEALLETQHLSVNSLLNHYLELKLAFKSLRVFFSEGFSILFSIAFWLIALFVVMSIVGYDKVPFFIYLLCVACFVFIPILLVVTLRIMSRVDEMSFRLLTSLRNRAEFEWKGEKVVFVLKCKRVTYYRAMACRQFYFEYYPFMKLDREFMLAVLVNLTDRMVDILLVFNSNL